MIEIQQSYYLTSLYLKASFQQSSNNCNTYLTQISKLGVIIGF
ncbi:protein of unknown function [Chryseobacterium sp. JV274]|nr:protein of unknown function [Chryseobacterium sp. JV274]